MALSRRRPSRIATRPGLAAAALALALCVSSAKAEARYKIRWVLVHDHSPAVERAARDFAARVEKETDGDVGVEVLSRADYGRKYKGGRKLGLLSVTQDVADGSLEMCQTYTTHLSHFYGRGLAILDLPYLFRDYAHAESVLDGPIGRGLLSTLEENSPLKGLAFTYSGGFGAFATIDKPVRSPADLRGLRMQMMRNRVADQTARRLGFEAISGPPEDFVPLAQNGLADGLETTYSCFSGYGDDRYAKYLTDTGHFLLTTMIVINRKFLAGLPEKDRKIVEDAARDAARDERRESVALASKLKRELAERGTTIIEPTAAEREAFVRTLAPVYDDVGTVMGPRAARTIEDIRNAKPAASVP